MRRTRPISEQRCENLRERRSPAQRPQGTDTCLSRDRTTAGQPRWPIALLACAGLSLLVAACSNGPGGASPTTTSTIGRHHRASSPTSTSSIPTTTSPSPATSTSSPTSTSAPSGPTVPVGGYTDATTGVPHYLLTVTASSPSNFAGTVTFVYQDGKTSTVFTFDTTPASSAFPLHGTGPGSSATAAISGTTITLPNCQTYLTYARQPTSCTFAPKG